MTGAGTAAALTISKRLSRLSRPFSCRRFERAIACSRIRAFALAGLSLGGEYALTVGLRHRELFRTVASISGSLVPPDFDNRFGAAFADASSIRRNDRLIWIGSGSEDTFYGGANALRARLDAAGIAHQSLDLPGPHVMPVFRKQLIELMPRLFR